MIEHYVAPQQIRKHTMFIILAFSNTAVAED